MSGVIFYAAGMLSAVALDAGGRGRHVAAVAAGALSLVLLYAALLS